MEQYSAQWHNTQHNKTIYIGAFCSVQMSGDWTHQAHATMPAVAERLRQAYPAPLGWAVGLMGEATAATAVTAAARPVLRITD